jgi:hypothetical protein
MRTCHAHVDVVDRGECGRGVRSGSAVKATASQFVVCCVRQRHAHGGVTHVRRVCALARLLHVVYLGLDAALQGDSHGSLWALPARSTALELHNRVLVVVWASPPLP